MNNLIQAKRNDKKRVIDILSKAFENDPQILWYVGEGKGKNRRLRVLMEFAFEKGFANEEVYLSPGKNAVTVWKRPGANKMTPMLMWLYLKFILIMGLPKVLEIEKLESSIGERYPKDKNYIYLWLLAVAPGHQGKGLSSQMLNSRLKANANRNIPVYLETSNPRNLPIYQKKGFQIYDQMELDAEKGSQLYFMRVAVEQRIPQPV